jgi:hypothetical protein
MNRLPTSSGALLASGAVEGCPALATIERIGTVFAADVLARFLSMRTFQEDR